eukprot:TRINITY_DN4908_c0_g4_i1.p1 TRINITY_DN4908_c0_g4~~TRINITY_DN4908_c0_g4_i1.p1  ORF type:complete len:562 (-),score=54.15 TRINITY_DN4908_c0_g4_i1:293-1978(-)
MFQRGRTLHGLIGAEKWGVTKQDLLDLRGQVRAAIATNKIVPTDRDLFDPNDDAIGPTMYTVVDQFIKPVTAHAGGMSWALMRNPKGVQCDIFITHAWREGIFEFIDKALVSWPLRCEGAYCCMLSNPQNANISELIGTPEQSPFATALKFAKYVLVVPNCHLSLYNRLWCVYEAFLASRWNKTIITARGPRLKKCLWALPPVCVTLCIGVLVALHADMFGFSGAGGFASYANDGVTASVVSHIFVLVSFLPDNDKLRRLINIIGAAFAGYATVRCNVMTYPPHMLYFLLAEVDRIRAIEAKTEAMHLKFDYSGSALDAGCSSEEDKHNIFVEIEGSLSVVDGTIQALVEAGMSTAALQQAQEAGVNIRCAAFAEYALAVASFAKLVTQLALINSMANPRFFLIVEAPVVVFFLSYPFMQKDQKAFALRVMMKVCVVAFSIKVPVLLIYLGGLMDLNSYRFLLWCCKLVVWPSITLFALVHIGRISRCPIVGPYLAQFLVSRTRFKCFWSGQEDARKEKRSAPDGHQSRDTSPRPRLVGYPCASLAGLSYSNDYFNETIEL